MVVKNIRTKLPFGFGQAPRFVSDASYGKRVGVPYSQAGAAGLALPARRRSGPLRGQRPHAVGKRWGPFLLGDPANFQHVRTPRRAHRLSAGDRIHIAALYDFSVQQVPFSLAEGGVAVGAGVHSNVILFLWNKVKVTKETQRSN